MSRPARTNDVDAMMPVLPPGHRYVEEVPLVRVVAKAEITRSPDALVPLIQRELQAGAEHYREAGLLLIEAKAGLKHGEWLPWLKKNFALSAREGQRYIALASNTTALSHLDGAATRHNVRRAPAPPSVQKWLSAFVVAFSDHAPEKVAESIQATDEWAEEIGSIIRYLGRVKKAAMDRARRS